MIGSFGNQLAEDLYYDKVSKDVRAFAKELWRAARRKLLYIHDTAELVDLKVPPGNKLEALRENLKGFYSIQVSDQWRVIFKWQNGNAFNVAIVDYH